MCAPFAVGVGIEFKLMVVLVPAAKTPFQTVGLAAIPSVYGFIVIVLIEERPSFLKVI